MKNTPYAQRFDSAPLGLDRLNPPAGSSMKRTAGVLSYTFESPRAQGKFVAALSDEELRFVENHFIETGASNEDTAQFLRRWK